MLTDREHEDVYKLYEPPRPDGPGDDGVEDGSAMRYEEEQDIRRFDTGGGKGGRTDAFIAAQTADAAMNAAAAAAVAMAGTRHRAAHVATISKTQTSPEAEQQNSFDRHIYKFV